jgi:hypothetical protein
MHALQLHVCPPAVRTVLACRCYLESTNDRHHPQAVLAQSVPAKVMKHRGATVFRYSMAAEVVNPVNVVNCLADRSWRSMIPTGKQPVDNPGNRDPAQ